MQRAAPPSQFMAWQVFNAIKMILLEYVTSQLYFTSIAVQTPCISTSSPIPRGGGGCMSLPMRLDSGFYRYRISSIMHSSRMCTVRYSGRLLRVRVSAQGGSIQRGCLLGGVCPGRSAGRGLPEGLSEGVCLGGGLSGILPPPMYRMTDAGENITFPQLLLRTVKIQVK